jgi:hypothetical protein
MEITEDFLTERKTAEILGVNTATMKNWAAARRGPPRIKIGRKAFYRREALTVWMQSREKRYEPDVTRGRG